MRSTTQLINRLAVTNFESDYNHLRTLYPKLTYAIADLESLGIEVDLFNGEYIGTLGFSIPRQSWFYRVAYRKADVETCKGALDVVVFRDS